MSVTKRFLSIAMLLLAACDIEDSRPNYSPIRNTVPVGGKVVEWDEERAQSNLDEVKAELDEEGRVVFTESMNWYATESEMVFEYLYGKTAKQIVDMINCLKAKAPDSRKGCVE